MTAVKIGSQYDLYQLVLIFFVYAFLGWISEVAFATLKTGKFVNRGFLNGPLCPIYGVGVALMLVMVTPFKNNFIILFLVSVALTTILEFITGFVLEKFFHKRWWDYTKEPFNIKGYICARMSILWGIACIIVVNVVNPPIYSLIKLIETKVLWLGYALMGLFVVLFITDLVLTILQILKLNERIKQLEKLNASMRVVSDAIGVKVSDITEDATTELNKLKVAVQGLQGKINKSRLVKSFPELLKIHRGDKSLKNPALEKNEYGDFLDEDKKD